MNQDQIAYIIKDVLHALIYLQVVFTTIYDHDHNHHHHHHHDHHHHKENQVLHRDVKGSNILLTHTAEVGDDDVDDDDHHGADHYSKDVRDNNDDDYDNADDLQVRLVDYGVSCTLADEEERRRSRVRRLMMIYI